MVTQWRAEGTREAEKLYFCLPNIRSAPVVLLLVTGLFWFHHSSRRKLLSVLLLLPYTHTCVCVCVYFSPDSGCFFFAEYLTSLAMSFVPALFRWLPQGKEMKLFSISCSLPNPSQPEHARALKVKVAHKRFGLQAFETARTPYKYSFRWKSQTSRVAAVQVARAIVPALPVCDVRWQNLII